MLQLLLLLTSRRKRIEYSAGYPSEADNCMGQSNALSNFTPRFHAQVQPAEPLQIYVQSCGPVGRDDSVSAIPHRDARGGEKDKG